jgi:hypothetical protein
MLPQCHIGGVEHNLKYDVKRIVGLDLSPVVAWDEVPRVWKVPQPR